MKWLCIILFVCAMQIMAQITGHDLKVLIEPEKHELSVKDTLSCRFEGKNARLEFALNQALELKLVSPGWKLENLGKIDPEHAGINGYFPSLGKTVSVCLYRIQGPEEIQGEAKVKVKYQGKLYFPLHSQSEEYARSFQETPGLICAKGVYLCGASFWYPQDKNAMCAFRLEVSTPLTWKVISQGKEMGVEEKKGRRITSWQSSVAMEEIYLAGGPLARYHKDAGSVSISVYLHDLDEALAQRYLTATARYLRMYENLLGPYPYSEFALVENFWETGYGMPGFTLLGPKIIRFPFIIVTSYPHEILHNWWGNGVFVDYQSGNWCEGLTAYLADHLMKERQGKGYEYRRQVLQKYRNFVRENQDFPLSQFRARHSGATEAVGYGKSLMLFHELRMRLGDEMFVKGLRRFYRDFRYRKAGFSDLMRTFSEVSGDNLGRFFRERVELKGAPQIRIRDVRSSRPAGKYLLQFRIEQAIESGPWQLQVPVAITVENQKQALWLKVPIEQENIQMSVALEDRPLRIDVDPCFDVFRKVDRSEIPPSTGQIFGASEVWMVMPDDVAPERARQYRNLAKRWGEKGTPLKLLKESKLDGLPKNICLWFLGCGKRFSPKLIKWLSLYRVRFDGKEVEMAGKRFSPDKHTFVFSVAHPASENMAIGWIFGGDSQALSALARKLPHYGKYSYLVFEGKEATNVLKGQWPVIGSSMSCLLTSKPVQMGELTPRSALASPPELADKGRMVSHVRFLASPELKGRGLGTPELDKATDYIAGEFQKLGLKPAGDRGTFLQTWEEMTGPASKKIRLNNVVALLPGSDKKFQYSPVVIGAHYDHLGMGWPDAKKGNRGKIHPGADDNASGVAVLLELAAIFRKSSNLRPVLFVAFTGEEAGCIGSRYFVAHGNKKRQIMAMINIDTVGRLGKRNLLVLCANSAREWPYLVHGCGYTANVPATAIIEELDSSDQMSFIEHEIPAVQIFSGAHTDYHTPGDTLDKIDFSGMVKVTAFLKELLDYLANRDTPLTATSAGKSPEKPKKGHKRRTSLGSIPDFAHVGKGVRLSGVTPNSPAAGAGLCRGDIIVKLGEFRVDKLSDLGKALRSYKPGDKVIVEYLHKDEKKQVEVALQER